MTEVKQPYHTVHRDSTAYNFTSLHFCKNPHVDIRVIEAELQVVLPHAVCKLLSEVFGLDCHVMKAYEVEASPTVCSCWLINIQDAFAVDGSSLAPKTLRALVGLLGVDGGLGRPRGGHGGEVDQCFEWKMRID